MGVGVGGGGDRSFRSIASGEGRSSVIEAKTEERDDEISLFRFRFHLFPGTIERENALFGVDLCPNLSPTRLIEARTVKATENER